MDRCKIGLGLSTSQLYLQGLDLSTNPTTSSQYLGILVEPEERRPPKGLWWLSFGQANCTGHCVSFQKVSRWCEAGIYLLASQAVDKCQSREGVDVALTDIETFLDTATEQQLPSPKEIYNQFELILTPDVKVMLVGYFHPVVGKEALGAFACC